MPTIPRPWFLVLLLLAVAVAVPATVPVAVQAGALPPPAAPVARALAPTGADAITIEDRGVTIDFPQQIVFRAHIAAGSPIQRVVLEYGVEKLTCGTVTAKALPPITPAPAIDVTWTWDMRKSGAEPPGARLWYRWHVTDQAGHEQVSERQRVVWLDQQHAWKSAGQDQLTLHWYNGTQAFANELLAAGTGALRQLQQTTGVHDTAPIDLYIYANSSDMRDATLYEPGWTGGQAFPTSDIVIIGIAPDQLDWGRQTVAHELTHVLVGHLTFSCLSSVPTWLNEGIAVYGEGGPDAAMRDQLRAAIAADTLISVPALSGGFSEHADKADLSYVESYSLVNYLVSTFGPDRMRALFAALHDGRTIEEALQATYNLNLAGLEAAWRQAIGARPPAAAVATAVVSATAVPTYPPIAAAPSSASAALAAPTARPAAPAAVTAGDSGIAAVGAATGPDAGVLILGLAAVLCAGGLVTGLLRLRSQRKRTL
jgi:hypothetical protein